MRPASTSTSRRRSNRGWGRTRAKAAIDLPGLTEPEAIRHYVRLSRNNYSIDAGLYPLGSCTMKHNPRLNEKMARLPGFADVHPLQPVSTAQGALEIIEALSQRAADDDRHGARSRCRQRPARTASSAA